MGSNYNKMGTNQCDKNVSNCPDVNVLEATNTSNPLNKTETKTANDPTSEAV
jgi:hypothetical protein